MVESIANYKYDLNTLRFLSTNNCSDKKIIGDFIEENDFSAVLSEQDTQVGRLLYWDGDSHAIFYALKKECHKIPIGEDEYRDRFETTYTLEGKLKGENTKLEARVLWKQDYKARILQGVTMSFPGYEELSDPQIEIERLDRSQYWFLTEPKTPFS